MPSCIAAYSAVLRLLAGSSMDCCSGIAFRSGLKAGVKTDVGNSLGVASFLLFLLFGSDVSRARRWFSTARRRQREAASRS